ncbi:hypothetical protein ACFVGN_41290, partial [Streptomyces sp. NPDC057757]
MNTPCDACVSTGIQAPPSSAARRWQRTPSPGGRKLSHKRIPKRKAAIAAGSVAALGAAALLLPNAMASQSGSDDADATARTFKAADVS